MAGPKGGPAVGGLVDGDRRQLDHLRAVAPQRGGQIGRLLSGTRHHDRPAEERAPLEPGEVEGGHRADDDRRGRVDGLIGDRRQRRPHRALLRSGSPGDGCHRCRVRAAGGDQALGDGRDAADAHQHDDRPADPGDGIPVDRALVARDRRVFVAGHHRERRRRVPQGDGDARVRRHRDRRRDPRDDLEVDAGVLQRRGLLTTAGEHEWVATLQADDLLTGPAPLDEQGVDVVLRHVLGAGPLADGDALRPVGRQVEQRRDRQAVVHDDLGGGEHRGAAHRDQPRISWSGADEEDRHDPGNLRGGPRGSPSGVRSLASALGSGSTNGAATRTRPWFPLLPRFARRAARAPSRFARLRPPARVTGRGDGVRGLRQPLSACGFGRAPPRWLHLLGAAGPGAPRRRARRATSHGRRPG